MASTMHAVVIETPGGPEALEVRELPRPIPRSGEVLIRVEAFGVNRSEQHFRRGLGSFGSFPRVPGLEAVGTVVAAPGGEFAPGQQVAALMGGMGRLFDGGYAEYTCVPAPIVVRFDSALDWEILGAVPEMLQTAHGSLTTGAGVKAGDTLLIRGGTSSIGLMCLALARLRGVETIATTRKEANAGLLKQAGAAQVVIDDGQVSQQVLALTDGRGVDAAVELVGVNVLGNTLRATRPGGVVCFTGMVSDHWSIAEFNPMDWIPNGVRLTAYSGEAKDLPPEVLQEYLDALADGTASPPPLTTYRGLEEARLAHEDMDHSRPGKKVVRVLHENGAES